MPSTAFLAGAGHRAAHALKPWRGTLTSFQAEVARIKAKREEGAPVMEEADSQAIEADTEGVGRIADVQARTLAGLCFKARVSADWNHDHPS